MDARPPTPVLIEVKSRRHDEFGIDHSTIQIEPEDFVKPEPPF